MFPILNTRTNFDPQKPLVVVIPKDKTELLLLSKIVILSQEEISYLNKLSEKEIYLFRLPRISEDIFLHLIKTSNNEISANKETFRSEGALLYKSLSRYNFEEIQFYTPEHDDLLLCYVEGYLLSSYSFVKYKNESNKNPLTALYIISSSILQRELNDLAVILQSVFLARDWINEPGSVLTAVELGKRISELGKEVGFMTEIWEKSKIKSLKMNGLLGVNRGSKNPPVFAVLQWKPENALNEKPIILVGKGIVFDTGGLSLKPTANSMDYMKSDMSGAAITTAIFYVVSKLKLPVHLIGLIPATDNRPGEDAILPGDIITIYGGTTVEVLNTDAEGRLILADALSYAKKYEPSLVIDFATLTGAASAAIGKYAMVGFFKTDEEEKMRIMNSAAETYERIVEFPLWDEYAELIKSDVAELKNTGGKDSGAITAAKFLEKFTDYPWIHFDIAGVSFSQNDYKYYPKGGTGYGIRLIIHYLTSKYNKQ